MRKITTTRSLVTYILLSIVTCGIYGLYFTYALARDMNEMCEGDGENTPGLLPFILLSLVTCSIYQFYWYYKLGNRIQTNCAKREINVTENGTTILLWMLIGSIICGIGAFVAMYYVIKNVNILADAYNAEVEAREFSAYAPIVEAPKEETAAEETADEDTAAEESEEE